MNYKLKLGKFSSEEWRNHFIKQLQPHLKKGEWIGSHRMSPSLLYGGRGFIYYGIYTRVKLFKRSWHLKMGYFNKYSGKDSSLDISVNTPRGRELAIKLSELIQPKVEITLCQELRCSQRNETK